MMIKLSDKVMHDEDALRTVYKALGVSAETTEAAIKFRRKKPVNAPKPPHGNKGKKALSRRPA
jgi:hypothetical protein